MWIKILNEDLFSAHGKEISVHFIHI